MNNLPRDKQIAVVSALCEGVSVRATSRLTGVNRNTILTLGLRLGAGCASLHDHMMRGVQVPRIELDEAWSFIAKKQAHRKPGDPMEFGDCYVFTALAGVAKAIISYRVGKRDGENCRTFLADLRERVLGAPEISSDAFPAYPGAVEEAFGTEVHFGTIEKHYGVDTAVEAARRYSPAQVVSVSRQVVNGRPVQISTSFIERSNLTIRMQCRRFTRLTNAFSKKLENHAAAFSLFVAHYNLCRVHETLRVTPAMQLGITDHIWTIGELVDAALDGVFAPTPPKGYRRFTVIDGGRS